MSEIPTQPTALIGVDIGGTKCAVSRLQSDGTMRELGRFATQRPETSLPEIVALIATAKPGTSPSIGIACGGPLDAARGRILGPPNLPGWDDVAIVDELVCRFGGRARLMNDANACALAEWQWGAGRGCRSMIFLTAGTGMGAGLILDGKLYEGTSGLAGEVGHLRLAPDGPEGYGKRGSFEGFCSGGGLARLARERAGTRVLPSGYSAKDLFDDARAGNPWALQVVEEAATRWGEALALMVDMLNPERIILGSLYVRARALLEPILKRVVAREALSAAGAACEILPANLGESLGNYSALAVALDGR